MAGSRHLFAAPEAAPVVVVDRTGSAALARMLLDGIAHTVLDLRGERYFLGLAVLARWVAGAWRLFLASPQYWPGELRRLYLRACLELMRPRVVVTFIDNSYDFQWLSRHGPKAVYLAIQNGVRSPYDVSSWLPRPPHPARTISMPELFCFGDYEPGLYRAHGHRVDAFHPVGSLRAGYYLRHLRPAGERAIRWDVCLVSQWWPGFPEDNAGVPEIRDSVAALHACLQAYPPRAGLRFCVAMRTADAREEAYFRSLFGPEADLVSNEEGSFATYRTMDASSIVVTHDSTAAREAFGWGKKVLFCNQSGHANYDLPCRGIWAPDVTDPASFALALDRLRAMPERDYAAAASGCAGHVMKSDPDNPAHEVIRRRIERALEASA